MNSPVSGLLLDYAQTGSWEGTVRQQISTSRLTTIRPKSVEAHIYEGVCDQVTLRGLFWIPKRYATREDLRLEQRFETPRSVERVQRAVHGDDIRVARVWTQLEAKIDK